MAAGVAPAARDAPFCFRCRIVLPTTAASTDEDEDERGGDSAPSIMSTIAAAPISSLRVVRVEGRGRRGACERERDSVKKKRSSKQHDCDYTYNVHSTRTRGSIGPGGTPCVDIRKPLAEWLRAFANEK